MRASCSSVSRGMSSYSASGKSRPAACASLALRSASISDSVHCLFLISSDVILTSPPCADDADDRFAIVILPRKFFAVCKSVRVNHQQNRLDAGTNGNCSQSMPTLLPSFIHAIKLDYSVEVLKHQRRQLKRDAVMLTLVLPVLPLIPFVARCVYTHGITFAMPRTANAAPRETVRLRIYA